MAAAADTGFTYVITGRSFCLLIGRRVRRGPSGEAARACGAHESRARRHHVRNGRRARAYLVTGNAERCSVPRPGNFVPDRGTGTPRDGDRDGDGTRLRRPRNSTAPPDRAASGTRSAPHRELDRTASERSHAVRAPRSRQGFEGEAPAASRPH
jgi:hypothetical protein